MKGAFAVFALLFLVTAARGQISSTKSEVGIVSVRQETSGKCGDNLEWEYDDIFGTLSIKGTGNMNDFSSDTGATPWTVWMGSIKAVVIDDGATSIGNFAFYNCHRLTSVAIPETVTTIGRYAFSGSGLTSLYLPESVNSIRDYAFAECNSLVSADITGNITIFETGVFYRCMNLRTVNISGNSPTIAAAAFFGCNNLTSVTLSAYVTSIGTDAFNGCSSLQTIIIPDSVEIIGNNAFLNCNSLTSVMIPSKVTTIEINAFGSCSELISINVDPRNPCFESVDGVLIDKVNKTLIQYPCGKTSDYQVPTNIASISSDAFYGCKRLTSVIIPDNVTKIEVETFYNCIGLRSIILPSNLISIQAQAFCGCSGLTSLTLPVNLETIGYNAFYGCSGLTHITIPSRVGLIGGHAFSSCDNLESIIYLGQTDPSPAFEVFDKCRSLKHICVPTDYNSSSFCGNNNLNKIISDEVENCCVEAICMGSRIEQIPRWNVSGWMNRTNGCVEYECENETCALISRNKCKTEEVCFNDSVCVDSNDVNDKHWIVVIEIDDSEDDPISTEEIMNQLSKDTGIKAEDITITTELDDKGHIIRIFVYADDESTTVIVTDYFNRCISSSSI